MSPLWGLGLWRFGISIHISPRWGCVGSFYRDGWLMNTCLNHGLSGLSLPRTGWETCTHEGVKRDE